MGLLRDNFQGELAIGYHFAFQDGSSTDYTVFLDPESFISREPELTDLPEWTEIGIVKPSAWPSRYPDRCPVAIRMVEPLSLFHHRISHERVMVTVTTPERNYVKQTDLQDGLRSLLGLLIATCGSPDVELFRPMARYHLPFGTLEESLFRIISVHFLQQYFAHGRQSITLDGAAITRFYEHISQINLDIVRRIRKTAPKDSMANALILLDSMANLLPMSIEEQLEELRYLFDAPER